MENVSGYLWNAFFISRGILDLFSLFLIFLAYNWSGLGTKFISLSVHRAIRRNSENITHKILMMEYCSKDKVYGQQRMEICLIFQKAYIQIYYPQLLSSNPRMLHDPLDVQVLVLISCGRYICMKKKNHHHHLLCKVRLWTLISHEIYRPVKIF